MQQSHAMAYNQDADAVGLTPPPSQSTLTGSAGRQAVIIGILLTRPCTVQYVTMSVESQNEDDVTTENKPRITSVTR